MRATIAGAIARAARMAPLPHVARAFGLPERLPRNVKLFARVHASCWFRLIHQPALCVNPSGRDKPDPGRWADTNCYAKLNCVPRPKEPAALPVLSVVDAYACS